MSTEAQLTPTTPTSTEPSAPAPATPAPAAAATPSAPTVVNTAGVPTSKLIGDDDSEIPDGEELLQFHPKTLKARLDRAAKKVLGNSLAELGVGSIADAKAKLDQLAAYEAKAEEQRLASLSELDRLKEIVAKTIAEKDAIQNRWAEYEQGLQMQQVETEVTSIASQYIDPEYVEFANTALRKHILSVDDSVYAADPDKFVQEFFTGFASKYTKMAKATLSAAPEPLPKIPVPISNGTSTQVLAATGKNPGIPGAGLPGKHWAPGRPDSLSDEEYAAAKRAAGYTF